MEIGIVWGPFRMCHDFKTAAAYAGLTASDRTAGLGNRRLSAARTVVIRAGASGDLVRQVVAALRASC